MPCSRVEIAAKKRKKARRSAELMSLLVTSKINLLAKRSSHVHSDSYGSTTIGLLPMPRNPIISTCAGTDEEPANCASECIRPIVAVIPYQAGLVAIFDFLCTTFEIRMNWLSLRKADCYE